MALNRQGPQSLEEGWNHIADSTTIINVTLDITETKPTLTTLCDVLDASKFIASFVQVTAPIMPPEARPISDLIYLNKAEEDAKDKKSAHSMNTVKILNSDDPDAIHYCKNVIEETEPDNPIVELETLNSGIANYLCPGFTPGETYEFYNENYKFVKVTSKSILNFKSNHEDPLTEHNFILDIKSLIIDNNEFNETQEECNKSLEDLSQLLNRNTVDENSSYLDKCKNATAGIYNFCNFYLNFAPTAVKCKHKIDQYLILKNTDAASLKEILQLLKGRLEYVSKVKIGDDININTQYKNEQMALEKAKDNIFRLMNTPKQIINNDILDIFDELEKITKAKEINIDELNETESRTENVFGKEYEFSVLALKNYSILKAMGYRRVLQKLENEGDDHNRNSGKKGGFDDDHKQEDVTYYFTKHSQAEIWLGLRRPKADTFKFTAGDYNILPHSIDAKPFYLPTAQIDVNESVVTAASFFYHDLKKNFFTVKDNEVFKKLATVPLFEYFKHQSTLKYILTDISIYENIHALYLRTAWKYTQQGDALKAFLDYDDHLNAKTLISKMNEKKALKIQEVTNALVTIPQFRDFLIYNGERALKIIKQEAQTYKDNLIRKLLTNPHYQNPDYQKLYQKLIDALDIQKFDKVYQEIYVKTLETTKKNFLQEMNSSQQMTSSQKMKHEEMRDSQKMVISQPLNNSSLMTDSSSPEEKPANIPEEVGLKLAMS